jgi:hypothetical protein
MLLIFSRRSALIVFLQRLLKPDGPDAPYRADLEETQFLAARVDSAVGHAQQLGDFAQRHSALTDY